MTVRCLRRLHTLLGAFCLQEQTTAAEATEAAAVLGSRRLLAKWASSAHRVVFTCASIMGTVFSALVVVGQKAGAFFLGLVGFSRLGPVAGSWAAALMSWLAKCAGGAIAKGSCFASAQSFAMGGAAPPVSAFLGAVFSTIAAATAAVCGYGLAKAAKHCRPS